MTFFKNPRFKIIVWLIVSITFLCCEPWVDQFEDVEDAVIYSTKQKLAPPNKVDTITVMTWNIRFGAGRIPWFGDSCGDRVILTEDEVLTHLQGIANKINEIPFLYKLFCFFSNLHNNIKLAHPFIGCRGGLGSPIGGVSKGQPLPPVFYVQGCASYVLFIYNMNYYII